MKIYFEEVFPEYVHSYENVISIPIIDTDEINAMVDAARVKDGKHPFFNKHPEIEMDLEAWYEVRLIIDRETLEPVELEVWGENCTEEDKGVYYFEITDKEDVKAQVMDALKCHHASVEELKGWSE